MLVKHGTSSSLKEEMHRATSGLLPVPLLATPRPDAPHTRVLGARRMVRPRSAGLLAPSDRVSSPVRLRFSRLVRSRSLVLHVAPNDLSRRRRTCRLVRGIFRLRGFHLVPGTEGRQPAELPPAGGRFHSVLSHVRAFLLSRQRAAR